MELSKKLLAVADWLVSDNNELLVEASDEQVDNLALSLTYAADTLRDAAANMHAEEVTQSAITPENLEEMAAIAAEFDASGDTVLKRQASVLDEILNTLASPKSYIFNFKKAEDAKIDVLKKKYKDIKEELDENIGVKEALDAIKDSSIAKEYRPMEASLSSRCCVSHPGAMLSRIGEGIYQCPMDHQVIDFNAGYTTVSGNKVPPGSVSEQTPKFNQENVAVFDSREQRQGYSG